MDFLELVENRYSCRSYKPDAVPRKHIEAMLEAARLAPSACNKQPWQFAVVTESGQREALINDGLLPGLGMHWAKEAPVLIVLGMTRDVITHRAAPMVSGVDYPLLDLGIAGEHLVLQATELGLGTCWIGWIKPRSIRKRVGWKKEVKPMSLITVGWPAKERPEETVRRTPDEMTDWL